MIMVAVVSLFIFLPFDPISEILDWVLKSGLGFVGGLGYVYAKFSR